MGWSPSSKSKQGLLYGSCLCRHSFLGLITGTRRQNRSRIPYWATGNAELPLTQVLALYLLRNRGSYDFLRLFCLPWHSLWLTNHDTEIHLSTVHSTCSHICPCNFHYCEHFEIQPDQLDRTSIFIWWDVALNHEAGCHDRVRSRHHGLPDWQVPLRHPNRDWFLQGLMSWSWGFRQCWYKPIGLHRTPLGTEKRRSDSRRWGDVRMSQPGMCSLLRKKRDSTLIRHVGLHVQTGFPQYILCWLGGPYPEVRCALQEPWARSPGTYANDHCHRFRSRLQYDARWLDPWHQPRISMEGRSEFATPANARKLCDEQFTLVSIDTKVQYHRVMRESGRKHMWDFGLQSQRPGDNRTAQIPERRKNHSEDRIDNGRKCWRS